MEVWGVSSPPELQERDKIGFNRLRVMAAAGSDAVARLYSVSVPEEKNFYEKEIFSVHP